MRTEQRRRDPLAAPARLIQANLRAGLLTPERVRLAGYLGHGPARLVLPAAEIKVPDRAAKWSLARRALRWGEWEPSLRVLAAADCAAHVVPPRGFGVWLATIQVQAARDWARCPCEEHRVAVVRARSVWAAAAEAAAAGARAWKGEVAVEWAARSVRAAAEAAAEAAAAGAAAAAAWSARAAAWAAAEEEEEEAWQSAHLGMALVSPTWPEVPCA